MIFGEEVAGTGVRGVQRVCPKSPREIAGYRIVFISLSPSIASGSRRTGKDAQRAGQGYIGQKPRLKYLETYDMVLGSDGQPRAELFVEDKPTSTAGYKLLAERVRPFLLK
jgi:hypothetical protein